MLIDSLWVDCRSEQLNAESHEICRKRYSLTPIFMEFIISYESHMKNISMASQVVSNAEDLRIMDPIPGLGKFPGGELGHSLQYSCLENPKDRGAWQVTANRVAKSRTGLKRFCCSCSVTQLCPTPRPHGLWHARLPCPSPSPRVCSNACSLSRCYHPTILSSVVPLSSYFQSFPSSGSFPMSQLFSSGGKSIVASASASVLPMNSHSWSPLRWTGLISFLSKGLTRVFSKTLSQRTLRRCKQNSVCSKT